MAGEAFSDTQEIVKNIGAEIPKREIRWKRISAGFVATLVYAPNCFNRVTEIHM